ncbi:hypothetical protein EHP00_1506 [Ecytonucleospora hepatopenaei]|uniref:Uncharacterized protein n=1 Tax=Ecytonucleospora hepatopenaei TaxID=646526 RepID=A0A1W0E3N7_9MICR|nr:hypothetical protein EHP00_1506 [Ecytonucleospora hepatopenaei]
MNLINNKTVYMNILYIVKNYGFFAKFIVESEKSNFSILDSIEMIKKIRFDHDKINLSKYLEKRIRKHFLNNYFYNKKMITENQNKVLLLPSSGSEVERSFIMLKDKRNFKKENIEMFFFIKYSGQQKFVDFYNSLIKTLQACLLVYNP